MKAASARLINVGPMAKTYAETHERIPEAGDANPGGTCSTSAKVTPSAMVCGLTPGKFREIDVLIETPIGPYNIKIAVESKDESRRFDVTAMEEIVGKYKGRNGILVDKVVVITHRGFTSEAEALAKAERIDTLTVAEVETSEWIQRMTCPVHGPSPWANIDKDQLFKLRMDPHVENVTFLPSLGSTELDQIAVIEGRICCRCHNHDFGTLAALANQILVFAVLPNKIAMDKLKEVALQNNGTAALHYNHALPSHCLRFCGDDHPLDQINVRIRYIDAAAPIEVKPMVMKDASGVESLLQCGDVNVGGKLITMLIPFGKQFERALLKIVDEKTPEDIEQHYKEYRGPSWKFVDGEWIEKQ